MKTNIFLLTFFLIFSAAAVSLGITNQQTTNKAAATVDRSDGLYIFVMCLPESPYESLGTVKKSLSWTGQPSEMLKDQVKKVKKEYPAAEGIIFNIDMDKAEAIKFK